MLTIHNWRRLTANIKAIFTGKPAPANTIGSNTKMTHKKLYIPRAGGQNMHYREKSIPMYTID